MADVGCEISNLESAIYHVPSVFFLLVVSCLLTAFLLNPQSAIFPLPAAFCPLISAAPPRLSNLNQANTRRIALQGSTFLLACGDFLERWSKPR